MKCYGKSKEKSKCTTQIAKNVGSYEEAVSNAVFGCNHQRRIKKETLIQYRNNILALETEFCHCKNFDEIHKLFFGAKIKGIGPLTVYDVSFRVGACFEMYPEVVYLHAGTEEGAIKLGLITKKGKAEYLTIESLPEWLKVIKPYQIEDFLCIYKDNPTKGRLYEYIKSDNFLMI